MAGELWTDANREKLLACKDDFEMQTAFPEHNLESLKRRRREFGGSATARVHKLADLLAKSGISIDEIANIKNVQLREWQVMHKDENGEAIVTDLEGTAIVLTPEWADGPKWQTIQRAQPKVVYPYAMPTRLSSQTKTAVIMPDMQVGFRRDRYNDSYDPFHDETAMNLVLQIMADLTQVDAVFNIGDGLDNAEFGRFVQEPAFANTSQKAIDYLSDFLAQVTVLTPHAERKYLEGNHDRRIENYLVKNAEKAYGIQRANRPDEWPVLSVPYLTRMDEIGWEYVPGYPANIAWINERVSVVHGEKVKSAGSTASAVIDDERVSCIFGHIHRIEKQHKTMRTFKGAKSNFAASIGCLCRTDGSVPSMKGSTDPYGRPIQRSENWQQGFAVVTYEEGDGFFDMEQIAIHEGRAFFRGNQYKA